MDHPDSSLIFYYASCHLGDARGLRAGSLVTFKPSDRVSVIRSSSACESRGGDYDRMRWIARLFAPCDVGCQRSQGLKRESEVSKEERVRNAHIWQ